MAAHRAGTARILYGMIWLHLDQDWWVGDRHVSAWPMADGDRVRLRYMGNYYDSVVLTCREGVPDHPEYWTRWGDHFRIHPVPRREEVVWQESESSGSLTVTVVRSGGEALWIEGEGGSLMRPVPHAVSSWRLVSLAPLSALAVEGKVGNKYWLVVADVYTLEVLYEGLVDKWSAQDSLEVVCTLDDMRLHRVQRRLGYREGVWCTLAHICTCTDDHVYIPKLLPYLFAEALAVGAMEEARSYLSPSLASAWEDLLAYVGEVEGVEIPPVGEGVGVLQGGVGRLLRVTVGQEGIDDMEWL